MACLSSSTVLSVEMVIWTFSCGPIFHSLPLSLPFTAHIQPVGGTHLQYSLEFGRMERQRTWWWIVINLCGVVMVNMDGDSYLLIWSRDYRTRTVHQLYSNTLSAGLIEVCVASCPQSVLLGMTFVRFYLATYPIQRVAFSLSMVRHSSSNPAVNSRLGRAKENGTREG